MKHIHTLALCYALCMTPVLVSAQSNSRALVEATYELMDLIDVESALRNALASQTDVLLESSPHMAPYRDVFLDFFAEDIDFESVKEKIAMQYMALFNETEIRDLITFYRSKTGQKMLRVESELTLAMMRIGEEMVRDKQHLLEERIRTREAQLKEEFAKSVDLFEFIPGRWDYTGDAPACTIAPFTLEVADDRSRFTISPEPTEEVADPQASVYDVLDVKPGFLRSRIIGEKRLTDDGEPVVWDIIPLDESSFCWRRTDWAENSCTAPVIRCD